MSCRDLDSAKRFKNVLSNALAEFGGVFWEDVKDSQLQSYLKNMSRDFFLEDGKIQKAVTVVGRQNMETLMENLKNNINHNPEDDVYVFNEYTQIYMFNKSLIKMKSISHVRGGPLEK